jgi:hypothetical protein
MRAARWLLVALFVAFAAVAVAPVVTTVHGDGPPVAIADP